MNCQHEALQHILSTEGKEYLYCPLCEYSNQITLKPKIMEYLLKTIDQMNITQLRAQHPKPARTGNWLQIHTYLSPCPFTAILTVVAYFFAMSSVAMLVVQFIIHLNA